MFRVGISTFSRQSGPTTWSNILLPPLTKTNYLTKATLQTRTANPYETEQKIGFFGWFLLSLPATAIGLGTWQLQRKKWKENLIADLYERTHSKPVSLPEDLSELSQMEYHPVTVKGTFDHSKEVYIGPRSFIKDGDASSEGSLMTKTSTTGYLVVTPFQLADRDLTILINRGWVPAKYMNPNTRPEGQVSKEVTITGVVRLNELRPMFTPEHYSTASSLLYRDMPLLCKRTGAAPVFLEAVEATTVDGGPIGGQTRITLRNEHLSYVITWYSLAGFTILMWCQNFLFKK